MIRKNMISFFVTVSLALAIAGAPLAVSLFSNIVSTNTSPVGAPHIMAGGCDTCSGGGG